VMEDRSEEGEEGRWDFILGLLRRWLEGGIASMVAAVRKWS
jgi:hypothetical protein